MAQIIGFFDSFLGGAVLAFIFSNLINLIELTAIMKVMTDVRKLLQQFKSEGESGKWLK